MLLFTAPFPFDRLRGFSLLSSWRFLVAEITGQVRLEPRYESGYPLLVFLVLWILGRSEALRKPCGALEQQDIGHGSRERPVIQGISGPAPPLVD